MKAPLQSKKWIMSLIGVGCVMVTYASSIAMLRFAPESASHITNIATQVITFMGGLVGAYTIGQSLVDWKSHSNSTIAATSIQSNTYEEKVERQVRVIEEGVNTDQPKPYNGAAIEEE